VWWLGNSGGDFTKPQPEKSGRSIKHVNHTHVFTPRKIKLQVRYNVKRFGRKSGIRDMRAEVILTKEMCQGLEKVLVFCCTWDMCDRLAASLDCDVYYSDSLDKRYALER
jgi:hypothetical protein